MRLAVAGDGGGEEGKREGRRAMDGRELWLLSKQSGGKSDRRQQTRETLPLLFVVVVSFSLTVSGVIYWNF